MKLEDQVCSLKLAKKLKELGVEQKSNWYWVHHTAFTFEQKPKLVEGWNLIYKDKMNPFREMVFSTFTVAELGEMLPERIYGNLLPYELDIIKDKIGWYVLYSRYPSIYTDSIEVFEGCRVVETTEANARAKMLIYLLENNLVKEG